MSLHYFVKRSIRILKVNSNYWNCEPKKTHQNVFVESNNYFFGSCRY